MYDIDKTIKHFESLQKRYEKMHQGNACQRAADALEALYLYRDSANKTEKFYSLLKDEANNVKTESSGVIYAHLL